MTKNDDQKEEMAKLKLEQLFYGMSEKIKSLERYIEKLENDIKELSEKKVAEGNIDDLVESLTISCELTPSVEKLFDNFSPDVLAEYLEKNENFCTLASHCPIDKYCEYHPDPEQLQEMFEKAYVEDYQVTERTNRAIIDHLDIFMLDDIKRRYNLVERNSLI